MPCPENSFTPSSVLNKDECREAKAQLNMDGSHSGANAFDEYTYTTMPYGCSFYYNSINDGIDARIMWNSDTTNGNTYGNRRICKQNGAYVAMNNSDDECPPGHSLTECTSWSTECNAGYYFTPGTGTSSSDTCKPCPAGTYQPYNNSTVAACIAHTQCPSGEYASGNKTHDATCLPCESGFTRGGSVTKEECRSFAESTSGLYVSRSFDTANYADAPKGCIAWGTTVYWNHYNGFKYDYTSPYVFRMCMVDGVFTKTDIGHTLTECPTTHSLTECRPWSTITCNAGFYVLQTSTRDSICTGCPAGTYQSDDNSDATQCTAWSTLSCPAGEYVKQSNTADAICTTCPAGTYQPDNGSNVTACIPYTPCPSGEYASGNKTHGATCLPCESGYYTRAGSVTKEECRSLAESTSGFTVSSYFDTFSSSSVPKGCITSGTYVRWNHYDGIQSDTNSTSYLRMCMVDGVFTKTNIGHTLTECPPTTHSFTECTQWSTITCNAGFYVLQTNTSDSICTGCPLDTYQSDDNSDATQCTAWSTLSCPAGEYATGTSTSDATCTTCPAGTYQPDNGSNVTACIPYTPCPSGEYASGNKTHDATCLPCESGFTRGGSVTEEECRSFAESTSGFYVSGIFDTFSSYFGPKGCIAYGSSVRWNHYDGIQSDFTSPNYFRMCMVDGVFTKTGIGHTLTECPPTTHSFTECTQWSTITCNAGFYVLQTNTSDSFCTECPLGTYQPNNNLNATQCTEWSTLSCSAGEYATGTSTSDATCTSCPTGTYQPDNESNATQCTVWSDLLCPAGEYVSGNATVDAMCTPCPAGTYQPVDNSNATACTPWSVISIEDVGKVLSISGNATSDYQLIKLENVSSDHLTGVSPHKLKSAFQSSNGCA